MNSEFWLKKWQNGEIGFHHSQYHSLLVKFGDKLTTGTILVPLCGKSLDILYLISKGHHVIGVELSSIACVNFFEEAKIKYSTTTVGEFTLYKSDSISLWCGDYFLLPQEVWDSLTGIYDRAALIALPQDIRQIYVAEILNRSSKKIEILLISLDYLKDSFSGPPFSIDEDEVHNLYNTFKIQKLGLKREERTLKNQPIAKVIEMTETIYWMQKS